MNSSGYTKIDRLLSSDELKVIKSLIVIKIKEVTQYEVDMLENYHTIPRELHERMLSRKSARVFSREEVKKITQLPGITWLKDHFSAFKMSNVVTEKGEARDHPEIYFRLVRPFEEGDIGTPHCDNWFHQAYELDYGRAGSTWKCWIAITAEPGLSGLEFYPYARQSEVVFYARNRKVSCDKVQPSLGKAELINTRPGDALLFRDDVLHSGAVNSGTITRSSVEITFV